MSETDRPAAALVQCLIEAASHADWMQVVLNQGPPCFFYEADTQRFCLRAHRWAGHTDRDEYPEHRFVSLADLLAAALRGGGSSPATDQVERLRQAANRLRMNDQYQAPIVYEVAHVCDSIADELTAGGGSSHIAGALQNADTAANVGACPICQRNLRSGKCPVHGEEEKNP